MVDAFPPTIDLFQDIQKNFNGYGETGEFTLARVNGRDIEYLHYRDKQTKGKNIFISRDADIAEPMQRALAGKSGIMKGLDYRGIEVLAAYVPVNIGDMGVVAKIDVSEFEKPFITAGIIAALGGAFLILFATIVFFRVSNRVVRDAQKNEIQLDAY